jgi:hypothetical protein
MISCPSEESKELCPNCSGNTKLRDFISEHAHLQALAGPTNDWIEAALKGLELLEAPHSLDQLWVWSRFCWIFGARDTWEANATVTQLLKERASLRALIQSYHEVTNAMKRLHWWNISRRRMLKLTARSLVKSMNVSTTIILGTLDTFADREKRWIDRDDFRAYVLKANG